MSINRPEPAPAHSVKNAFVAALLRLKLQAGLQTDRDVADLLGMGEKAFTSRKRRGAFPEDKVLALAVRRPDLQIDTHYVLTGQPALREDALAPCAATTGDEFMPALLRLQRLLGVSKDKEVAEALGLSVTALSERKRRGSFPIERLHDLARRRPDLAIDTHYVLTGQPTPAPASLTQGGHMSSHRLPRECTYSYARQLRRMRWTAPRMVIHSVPVGILDHVDVVGDPEAASYEYVILNDHQVATFSDSGYGSPEVALRDGLIAYLGPPDSLKPVKPAEAPPPAEAIPGLGVTEVTDPAERDRILAEAAGRAAQ